jgi:hypothetical protein
MPSKSRAQAALFRAAAHSPSFAKKVGVSQTVAREFEAADKRLAEAKPSLAAGKRSAARRVKR